jgi:hypothetical protein
VTSFPRLPTSTTTVSDTRETSVRLKPDTQ